MDGWRRIKGTKKGNEKTKLLMKGRDYRDQAWWSEDAGTEAGGSEGKRKEGWY